MTDERSNDQRFAKQYVIALHTTLRAVRLYPAKNTVVRNSLADLTTITNKLFATFNACSLRAVGDYLFVNDTRVRLQLDVYAAIAHVIGRLRMAGAGGIVLSAPPDATAWMAFLSALLQPAIEASESDRYDRLVARLATDGLTQFHLEPALDEDIDIDEESDQERARQTFMRSLSATRDILTAARVGRSPALKQVKRAVQGIVDSIMSDSTSIVGLTTLREFDEYTFVHSVNVCILSVALGRRIGLNKVQLLDLGLAALMHDIGKSRVPIDVLNKRGRLEDHEFRVLQSHTWRGVLALFALRGSASRAWRAMTTAYEHHMRMDLTGYPPPIRPRTLSLFSKIVTIVDGFDAATTTRVYQPRPWSPADVVRGMIDNPSLALDPVLVKAFVNLTGIYPVGTLVVLDTREIALVHQANSDTGALARPVVRILFDPLGQQLADGPLVNLTERDPAGNYLRTIIRTDDPERHGIRVSDYLA